MKLFSIKYYNNIILRGLISKYITIIEERITPIIL